MPKVMHKTGTLLGQLLVGKGETVTVRNRLVSGAGGLLALRMAFSGTAFLTTMILARLLGPAAFGAYSYALAWIVFLGIPAILGMDQLMIREIAASYSKHDWGTMRGLLRHANWSVFLASTGMALAAGTVAWFLIRPSGVNTRATFLIALPFLPLITLTRVRQGAMQGLHRVALGALPEQLIQPVLFLLFIGVSDWLRVSLNAPLTMGANVAAAAVAFTAGWWLLYRCLPLAAKTATPIYRDSDWARSALPLMFVAGGTVLFGQADTLILGVFKGATDVGIYSVAHKGADLISVVLNVQNAAFASTVAGLFAVGELARLQALVTRLARWTLLASLPLGIGLIAMGHWFLGLYGPRFVEARTVLAIITIGQLANVSVGCVHLLLVMTGHERRLASAIAAGAIANVALSLALAPRWGATGVAVAYALSMLLWSGWAAVTLYRTTGLNSSVLGLPLLHRPSHKPASQIGG